jgi:hypothetical protein
MRITKAHIDFYRSKKAPATGLEARIPPRKLFWSYLKPTAVIDELINSQTPTGIRQSTEPHNLLNFIRGWRHRGEDILVELKRTAYEPYNTDPKRRTAYARRWYVKLFCQRLREVGAAIMALNKPID